MRCFNHQDNHAVGSCKHCGKGLCPACLTDLGHGLACRDSHEPQVESVNTLITRNTQAQHIAPKTWFVVPAFTAFLGLVFAGYGLFSDSGVGSFTTIMGIGFLVYAAVLFVANHRAFKAPGTQA